MIIVTGAAGFIGSCMVSQLNTEGYNHIVAVDDFSRKDKQKNLENKKVLAYVERAVFFSWVQDHYKNIECIIHLGARTDTREQDQDIFDELNLHYSQQVWNVCVEQQIPLIYASSAATYGNGEYGYDENQIQKLQPLNPYGWSKQNFDIWALAQKEKPFFWVGLKFFNIYGPNEYHKGRMASVVFHAYKQAQKEGKVHLFRSHNTDYKDGEQKRDFLYVKDLVKVISFFMHKRKGSGIYNLGTGKARTFLSLAQGVVDSLSRNIPIEFVDTPLSIRENYQYFTQANMQKLHQAGYPVAEFYTLEEGIDDYITNYLSKEVYF